jgi:hypothetical protein
MGIRNKLLKGDKFNYLTVGGMYGKKYLCRCKCGHGTFATYHQLKHGLKKSCGCARGDRGKENLALYIKEKKKSIHTPLKKCKSK